MTRVEVERANELIAEISEIVANNRPDSLPVISELAAKLDELEALTGIEVSAYDFNAFVNLAQLFESSGLNRHNIAADDTGLDNEPTEEQVDSWAVVPGELIGEEVE